MSTSVKEQTEQLRGLLKVGKAAELCGVTAETLRNWDRSGTLVARRNPMTGYRYYRIEDINEFIERRLNERKSNR